jgi:hypothetical protein
LGRKIFIGIGNIQFDATGSIHGKVSEDALFPWN